MKILIALICALSCVPASMAAEPKSERQSSTSVESGTNGKIIAKALCDGFKAGGEKNGCSTLTEARQLLSSKDPEEQRRGKNCVSTIGPIASACGLN